MGFTRPPGNDQIFEDGSIAMHFQLFALVLVAQPLYVGLDGVTGEFPRWIGLEVISPTSITATVSKKPDSFIDAEKSNFY